MAKRNYKDLVFSVTDCFGNCVQLAVLTWQGHILDPTDGHPQMTGFETLVEHVLEDPLEVWTGQWPTSAVFVSDPAVGPSPDGIRAVVNYNAVTFEKGGTVGSVSTAYPIDFVGYPYPRMGKRILKNR